jgi:hypothetical protein
MRTGNFLVVLYNQMNANTLPSSASAITAEAMSMDEISDKEQLDTGTTHSGVNDDQLLHSLAADQ